jgi:beta-xylosidase/AraC-like DNA-binding protein
MQDLFDTVKLALTKINSLSVSKDNLTYLLIFILKGQVHVNPGTDRKLLQENDIYLIKRNTPARLSGGDGNIVLMLELPSYFLEDMIEDASGIQCDSVSDKSRDYSPLRSALVNLAKSHFNTEAHLLYHSNMYRLMYLLSNDYYNKPEYSGKEGESFDKDKRMIKIRRYIRKNYRYPITMQDLAKYVHLTPGYLSRFIKKNLGKNFIDYLNEIRLQNAVIELLSTDNTVTSISFNHGFPNMTAFNKIFRQKYHETPLRYRKNNQEKKNDAVVSLDIDKMDVKLAEEYLKPHLDLSSSNTLATKDRKQLNVTLESQRQMNKVWKEVINLGFVTNLSDSDFQQQVLSVQHELNFHYSRIEGMFNSGIITHIPNASQFNFSDVNKALDFLLSAHFIPFIELAPKPIKISTSTSNYLYLKKEIDLFSTPKDWEMLLQDFINNCINRYGIKEVEKWKFEYRAQHGIFEFTIEWLDQFLDCFATSFKVIKALLPGAQIGGPGYNLAADDKALVCILDGFRKTGITPDFISVYSFHREISVSPSGKHPCFTTKPNYLSWRISLAKKELRKFGFDCPVFITQWDFDNTSRNYLNDSVFKASFIVKNVLENMDAVSMMGYLMLSDLTANYADVSRILFGGNGLVAVNGLLKPSYYAYYFLSLLGEKLVEKGQGYIVTTNGKYDYQILLYHYCHPTDHYCLCGDSVLNKDNINDIFGDAEKKSISIRLNGISPGKYRIKKLTLNSRYGSVLDQWNKLTDVYDLSPEEINHLKNTSQPAMSIFYYEASNDITVNADMDVNEICIFLIKRQFAV